MSKLSYRYLMLGIVLSACHQSGSNGGDTSSQSPSPEVTAPTDGASTETPAIPAPAPTEDMTVTPTEATASAPETPVEVAGPTNAPEVVAPTPAPTPAPVPRPEAKSTFTFTVDGQTRTYSTKNPFMCSLKPHIITHNSTLRVLIPDERDGDAESTKHATANIELVYVTRLSPQGIIRGQEAYGSTISLGLTDRIMYANASEARDMSYDYLSRGDSSYGSNLHGLFDDRSSPASDCIVELNWTQQGVAGSFVCSNLRRVNLDAGIAGISANKYSATGSFSCPFVMSN